MSAATVLTEGLYFGEGPRWHDGRLWFSDFYAHAVKSVGRDGGQRVELEMDDQPSGLGWLPDGRLLVVSMADMKLLRLDPDGLKVHADLSEFSAHLCNDMVVDNHGRAWVGNFGFDLDAQIEEKGVEVALADHPATNLVRVDPDGSVHRASPDMHFPNGMVITPDGKTLIVAETLSMCLTAFDIEGDGSLRNRRVWAEVGMRAPDGICLNEAGNVWVANALAAECVLVGEGGEILQSVETSQPCFACMLGGDDGHTLHMVTAQSSDKRAASAEPTGKIEVCTVDVAGAGCP
ncbi:MAG: SMP-30/gluconolactonase/LRE family protein [Proteobacteria bacterium]|nr:SMP-30/gluconolactonase/LRE family protein [Pseudomonadota bacterium]